MRRYVSVGMVIMLAQSCFASYSITLDPGAQECFLLRALDTFTMVRYEQAASLASIVNE